MNILQNKFPMVYRVLSVLIMLYSFTTITLTWYPFSMNRVLTAGMILCFLLILLQNLTKSDILLMCCLGTCLVLSSLSSNNLKTHINDYLYLFTSALCVKIFSKEAERRKLFLAFRENKKLAKAISCICIAVIFISLFFSSSYNYEWGETTQYFCGFAGGPHAIAPGICLTMALFTLVVIEKAFHPPYLMILLFLQYTIFMTGARVSAVPSTLIIIIYINNTAQSIKSKYIRFAVAACLIAVSFFLSPMTDKFSLLLGNTKITEASFTQMSHGRVSIWNCLLDAYKKETLAFQIFGGGFDQVYSITAKALGQSWWAHNDYLQLLIGTGIFGLFIHLLVFAGLFRNLFKHEHLICVLAMVVYIVFPAFINGWYIHFHMVLSLIILTLCGNARTAPSASVDDTKGCS